jgi:hypothetical protein
LRTKFPLPLDQIRGELLRTGRWEGELWKSKADGSQVVVASRWSLRRDERASALRSRCAAARLPGRGPATQSHGQFWLESVQRRTLLVGRNLPDLRVRRVDHAHNGPPAPTNSPGRSCLLAAGGRARGESGTGLHSGVSIADVRRQDQTYSCRRACFAK